MIIIFYETKFIKLLRNYSISAN